MEALENLSYTSQIRQLRILAEAALTHYDIGNVRVTLLSQHKDTLFQVTTARRHGLNGAGPENARFVLRLYQPPAPAPEMILSEFEWLAMLRHSAGLGVPEPVAARNGSYITEIEIEGIPEQRHCVLMRWIEGRFVDTRLTPTLMERVGMFLARMHQQSEHFNPSTRFTRPHWNWQYFPATGTVLDHEFVSEQGEGLISEQAYRIFVASAEKISQQVQTFFVDDKHYGLTHGDFQQSNYLFHKGEVRAIDFEDCRWNFYLFDVAAALQGIADRPQEVALRSALLSGYEQMRALPRSYQEQLPTFMAACVLGKVNALLHVQNPYMRAETTSYREYAVHKLRTFVENDTTQHF